MALDSVLTFFALAISPVVAATFACLFWFKRDPASHPSIVAAIPLGLSSIAILLAQSAVVLLATFQEIATHKALEFERSSQVCLRHSGRSSGALSTWAFVCSC